MAKPNYQYEKRQRDLAKKNKQEEKRRQKLADKAADGGVEPSEAPSSDTDSAAVADTDGEAAPGA